MPMSTFVHALLLPVSLVVCVTTILGIHDATSQEAVNRGLCLLGVNLIVVGGTMGLQFSQACTIVLALALGCACGSMMCPQSLWRTVVESRWSVRVAGHQLLIAALSALTIVQFAAGAIRNRSISKQVVKRAQMHETQAATLAVLASPSSETKQDSDSQDTREHAAVEVGTSGFNRMVGEDDLHCWQPAEGNTFKVRSAGYYNKHKRKSLSDVSFCHLVSVDIWSSPRKLERVCERITIPDPPAGCTNLVINLMYPDYPPSLFGASGTKDKNGFADGKGFSIVFVFQVDVSETDTKGTLSNAEVLMRRFVTDAPYDKELMERLKMIVRVANGTEVGLSGIYKRTCEHYNGKPFMTRPEHSFMTGPNYLGIDLDHHRYNDLALNVYYHCLTPHMGKAVWEVALVIQGNSSEELPEQILGCVQMVRLQQDMITPFPTDMAAGRVAAAATAQVSKPIKQRQTEKETPPPPAATASSPPPPPPQTPRTPAPAAPAPAPAAPASAPAVVVAERSRPEVTDEAETHMETIAVHHTQHGGWLWISTGAHSAFASTSTETMVRRWVFVQGDSLVIQIRSSPPLGIGDQIGPTPFQLLLKIGEQSESEGREETANRHLGLLGCSLSLLSSVPHGLRITTPEGTVINLAAAAAFELTAWSTAIYNGIKPILKDGYDTWVVPAGGRLVVPVLVPCPNITICWEFSTQAHSIKFGVAFQSQTPHGEVKLADLVHMQRQDSHKAAVKGRVSCPDMGVALLSWDNTLSNLTPKKLTYKVQKRVPLW